MESAAKNPYEVRIHPGQRWLALDFHSIFEFRDLMFLLVRRDFKVKYEQTILGPIWVFLQPFLTTIVFTIIFNRVGRLPTDGLPPMLFYFAGVTIWTYFQQNLNLTSNTFTYNSHLFEKVFFPRVIVPLATTLSNMLSLGIQLICLIGFIVFFKFQGATFSASIPEAVICLPLVILQAAALSLGFGLLFSSMTAKYRDLAQLIAFILQLWMYATPVVYPASNLPPQYRWLVLANPVAPIVENFRGLFLGTTSVTWLETAVSVALTLIILLIGYLAFQRTQRRFIDSV
jgi:lipopolysaccharide transport system permease protein